jgi:hypothetical protein
MTGKQDSHLLLIYAKPSPIALGCMCHKLRANPFYNDKQEEFLW